MTRPGLRLEIVPKFEGPTVAEHTTSLRLRDSEHAAAPIQASSDLDVSPIEPPAGTDRWTYIGDSLAQKLRGNPAVDAALAACLAAGPGPSHPIKLEIQQQTAAALPWEALYDATHEFLALDARWPIVRVIKPEEVQLSLDPSDIRVAVVLSALDRKGTQQWHAILERTRQFREDSGLGIRLKAFVSEADLLQEIEGEVESLPPGNNWIAVETVTADLLQDLKMFQPHLLHIFSHGTSKNGTRQLELAKLTDWGQANGTSSIYIDVSALAAAVGDLETWLCIINACEGGRGDAESYAMAADLVEAGLPAAIGMREVIDKLDADRFCKAFYTEVLLGIKTIVENDGGELPLADMIGEPRRQLRLAHDGATSANWALPVLFTKAEPLMIDVVSPLEEAESTREDVLRGLRDVIEPAAARPELVTELSDAL